jgi:chemotaxis protein CheY-P-specific phosphatase CheC
MCNENLERSKDLLVLDTFKEIVNIGISEAGHSLSEILKRRILLRVSELLFLDTNEISDFLLKELPDIGVLIMQGFHGELNGISTLAYSHEYADTLMSLLIGKEKSISAYQVSDLASLEEFGNILSVSCISTIANICNVRIRFDLPKVYINLTRLIVENLTSAYGQFEKYLILKNLISIGDFEIEGYLLFLLSFENFEQIVDSLIVNYRNQLKGKK